MSQKTVTLTKESAEVIEKLRALQYIQITKWIVTIMPDWNPDTDSINLIYGISDPEYRPGTKNIRYWRNKLIVEEGNKLLNSKFVDYMHKLNTRGGNIYDGK